MATPMCADDVTLGRLQGSRNWDAAFSLAGTILGIKLFIPLIHNAKKGILIFLMCNSLPRLSEGLDQGGLSISSFSSETCPKLPS